MVGSTCGICALILSLSPDNETVSAYAPVILKVSDPVIIDTVNVFDIYQPTDEAQEPVVRPAPSGLLVLSDHDLDLAAQMVHAEAGNQSLKGKRLVADVILNRMDSPLFPNDVESVVSQEGQFSTYKIRHRYTPDVSDYDAVISELDVRLDDEVLYFASNHYIGRTPLYKVGDHYFSK